MVIIPAQQSDDEEDVSLMAVLYRAAAINIAVRRRYTAIKDDPDARYFVYVLLLQSGKLYVGSTNNPYTRFLDHFLVTPSSAAWVREWGPPVRVVELLQNCRADDEQYKYYEYASMFGWENVRGGTNCRVIMPRPPPGLDAFERDPMRKFEFVPRAEIDCIVRDAMALGRKLV
jgi:hypothetical protein